MFSVIIMCIYVLQRIMLIVIVIVMVDLKTMFPNPNDRHHRAITMLRLHHRRRSTENSFFLCLRLMLGLLIKLVVLAVLANLLQLY
jgi:hypothetical protein